MNLQLAASDWAAERGKKWRDQLSGMEAMLAPIDAPLVEALRLDNPLRIADIGCGGGGATLAIHCQAPAGSCVHGFDISPDLVESAKARTGAADGGLVFHLADVSTASPPGQAYDRLASRFGIMFFDNPPQAFSNLASWLIPGGRFAFAVWGPALDNPWMTTFRDVASQVIEVPAPDPDAPGPFRYGGAEGLLSLLDAAGFGDLAVQDWHGPLALGGGLPAAQAADFTLDSFSVGETLAKADEADIAKVRRLLAARYAEHEQDGTVLLDGRVHVVTGRRPA